MIVLVVSCASIKPEKKLLGKWYTSDGNNIISEFGFYKDSLIIYDTLGSSGSVWRVSNDTLYTTFKNNENSIYTYQLDESKHSLSLELVGNNDLNIPTLTKAKNTFDFFQKTKDITIDLPLKHTPLEPIGFPNYLNFNIYAGFKNKVLVVKTDESKDLDNLEKEVAFFIEHSRDELKPHLRFNLIADKRITETQIDSIKNILNKTAIKQAYRTYKSKENTYENEMNWYGLKE